MTDTQTLTGPMVMPEEGEPGRIVLLLHGYGSDGDDLIALAQYLKPEMADAMFVAPNAPEACDINPDGYQWFALDLDRELSRLDGTAAARPVIMKLLEDLWAQTGLGPAETLIVGFSQGGMMALDVGLRLDPAPIGIVSFSGALVDPERVTEELGGKPPVALIHGTVDEVVPAESAQIAEAHLKRMGIATALKLDHGVGHTITPDGLGFAVAFIREVTGNGRSAAAGG